MATAWLRDFTPSLPSYGTVSEPCYQWQKFPSPKVAMRQYLDGTSAIEELRLR